MSEDAIKIFYSYSRKDLDMRNALEDHLSTLREAGKISTWHDLELEAGTEWEPAILHKLDTADIILLLISSSFIASKYCYGTELKRAIALHDAGTARVIPIILRHCDWNHSYVPFSKLNVLPTHAKPITKWEDRDEAFETVAKRIRETVDQLNAQKLAERQAEEEKQRQAERLKRDTEVASLMPQHASFADIATLKNDARRAERKQDWDLAKQLWIRVLAAASGQDMEAIEALQTIAVRQTREIIPTHLQSIPKLPVQPRTLEPSTSVPEVQAAKSDDDDLSSEPLEANYYARLQDLLKAGKWKQADGETYEVMIRAVGKKSGDRFEKYDLLNFSCVGLKTIDQLWTKYSSGQFGFSVQKQIYVECGGRLDDEVPGVTYWREFGEKIGWLSNNGWIYYENVTFDISAPRGHLPTGMGGSIYGIWWGWQDSFPYIASRLVDCKIDVPESKSSH